MSRLPLLLSVLALALGSASVGCSSGALEPAPNGSTTDDATTDDDSELNAAAAANAAPIGRAAHAKLKDLAPKVTLGMFGEDSGTLCRATFRVGPAERLSAEEVLRLFQFNVEQQMASDEFEFRAIDKNDDETWSSFETTQWDDEGLAAAKEIEALFKGPDVKQIAMMIPADRVPFGASVFLVALMKDGSLLALRGEVGGMAF